MAGKNNNAKIWQEAAAATKECPTLETLEKVMDGVSSDQQAVAHVSSCPHCQSEISMLRSFESATPAENEGAAVAWIAAQLERNQQKKAAAPARATVVPFWRTMFRLPYMAAAAALIVAVTLGISLYQNEDRHPHFGGNVGVGTYRGEMHLIQPAGELSQAPSQLKWESVPGAASYSVQITGIDIDHTVVWEGQSTQNFVSLTPEMKSKIRPGKQLEWKVTAQDATRKQIATGEGRFRVILK
jgi:hypothetical protein